jgi:hypothetical protein
MKLHYFAGIIGLILVFYIYYKMSTIEGFYQPTTKAMIIVEPRKHKLLKQVIENFDKHMDKSWDLYVFHGASFGEYAKECTSQIKSRNVFLIALDKDNLNVDEYNSIFKKEQFWDKINAEDILVFQTDTVICGSSLDTIDKYIQYDYIGCSYDNTSIGKYDNNMWANTEFYGIGGLSFRKKAFMLKCIDDNKDVADNFPEDIFFSICVARSSNRPPSAIVLNQFCTQHVFVEKSWGAHKTNIDLKNKDKFYEYCPEARMLENS